jgi:hypothetical protein
MNEWRLRSMLPRVILLSLLLSASSTALLADDWQCPDCYRCDHGCSLGSNSYGFTACALNEDGSCNPNGGDPCCLPQAGG